jgi:hypothetical protein
MLVEARGRACPRSAAIVPAMPTSWGALSGANIRVNDGRWLARRQRQWAMDQSTRVHPVVVPSSCGMWRKRTGVVRVSYSCGCRSLAERTECLYFKKEQNVWLGKFILRTAPGLLLVKKAALSDHSSRFGCQFYTQQSKNTLPRSSDNKRITTALYEQINQISPSYNERIMPHVQPSRFLLRKKNIGWCAYSV